MKTKLNSPGSASFNLASARSHARLARQLSRSSGHSSEVFASNKNLFGSLWSPVRLDLLKVPLTRHHE